MRKLDQVVFAALLHDIGKFMQRAGVLCEGVDETVKQLILPRSPRGYYTHQHCLWTDAFFRKFGDLLPRPAEQFSRSDENMANAAARHHSPSTALEWLLAEADRIASGHDRRDRGEDDAPSRSDSFRRVRLRSVLAQVDLGLAEKPQEVWSHNLQPLAPTKEALFPKRGSSEDELLTDDYAALWQWFEAEFTSSMGGLRSNPRLAYQRLSWLLQKYTWCIPSSTVDEPDISLFDHSRVVAAIAACLFLYHEETASWSIPAIRDRSAKKMLFLAGDLSGIQRSLFAFAPGHNKGVAKVLRARSFFFSALSAAALYLIQRELGIHPAQTVLDAGGRFLVLIPNTESVLARLRDLRRKVDAWCKHMFAGSLVLNLDWSVSFCASDLISSNEGTHSRAEGNRLAELLENVRTALTESKNKKLGSVLQGPDGWRETFLIEDDYDQYAQNGACSSCGQEPATSGGFSEGEDEQGLGMRCRMLRSLGAQLAHRCVLAWSYADGLSSAAVGFFDNDVYLSLLDEAKALSAALSDNVVSLEELNQPDTQFACRFLANHVPLYKEGDPRLKDWQPEEGEKPKPGGILPFSAIAARREQGVEMLGLMKGDVDRLGQVFSKGIPPSDFSMSRFATLSRMLDLFFSGYVNQVLSSDEIYSNTYVVYAGGDDFFLVADWLGALKLASHLEEDFRAFVCENRNVTLSAAVNFTKPNYPLRLGAQHAESLLKRAKNEGRDRLAVFDHAVPWHVFRNTLVPYHEFLVESVCNKVFTISFVRRLLHYHRMHENVKSKGIVSDVIYRSRLSYDIGRNILGDEDKRRKVSKDTIDQLNRLYDLRTQDKVLMDNLSIPVQWTLFELREGGD